MLQKIINLNHGINEQLPSDVTTQLSRFQLSKTTIIADMSGTLLMRHPGGFPTQARETIRKIFDSCKQFIIVTGDTYPIIESEFLKPLGYQGSKPPIILAELSNHIFTTQGTQIAKEIHRVKPMTKELQQVLWPRIISILRQFKPSLDIPFPEEYGITPIAEALSLEGDLYIEVRPFKISIDFNDSLDQNKKQLILQAVSALDIENMDTGLCKLLAHYFVSFHFGDKSKGINKFISTPLGTSLKLQQQAIIMLGDSNNDLDMFGLLAPDQSLGQSQALAVYLGTDHSYLPTLQTICPEKWVHAPGYAESTTQIFQQLLYSHQ